ncbi:hypothetical protein T310_5163 [Rasamsonia emersonii CBS 393.64]|uniref:Uncharacterized protein n=1 Tax=Rasamsonia emersonii (strain ATCC 16479 / CBS 393.64 / IMI 116815) TaxID=1408163 RepID=A0A0F4YRU0_RASE3|nr:hypothetical protein T310_5163 [Rasamsonia emersonii CBS 393.64]KKA20800.1 hypothetical protein T310_5163 [Rasamsonia emersonii CBS 393.64]
MRSFTVSPALSILALLAAQTQPVQSTPFPLEYDNILVDRACANPCGYYGQICCTSTQTCGTNSAGQAVCLEDGQSGESGSSGTWKYYTTTYTTAEQVTVTSVWSSYITPAPTSSASTCQVSLGESICGSSCCNAAEVCENGVCVAGSSSAAVIPSATPPLRPTSSGAATVTETSAPTTTMPFIAPVGTDGATVVAQASGHGLSGGAIAGIVIGTIAGVFLLLALCFCFCLRGALDGLLALIGLGPRRRRETTHVEERYSHHGSERPERRTWFGTRPSRPEGSEGGKSSGLGFWGTLALIAGAIALCLGLRRRESRDEKSTDYYTDTASYSYYSYGDSYYYTSATRALIDGHEGPEIRGERAPRGELDPVDDKNGCFSSSSLLYGTVIEHSLHKRLT